MAVHDVVYLINAVLASTCLKEVRHNLGVASTQSTQKS